MAGKRKNNPVVYALLGLLILALGGFGATNLSGTIRSIGSVGDVDIDVNDYARNLQREIQALEAERGEAIRFSEARNLGVSERVLSQLVSTAAFDHEARQFGLSIGDENLRDEILAMPQFRGLDGSFNRDSYRFALDQAGLTEGQFENDVRADTARSILQAAVMSGIQMPTGFSETMTAYLGEQRDVTWSVLDRADLVTGLPVATESNLSTYLTENQDDFTIPESKRITYAWLTPDMILDTVEIDEQSLRDAYEAREDEFNRPERRLVERLIFPSDADAAEAQARLASGEISFEALVEERGLALTDVDLGDVERSELGDAGDAVFEAEVGTLAGPVPTSLGPALFRVNAILSAQVTSFEDAQSELRAGLATDRARRVVDGMIETVDDLLAGGATVEDVATETELELGQIDWHAGVSEGIAAYEAFRTAAAPLNENDYPDVMQLDDGGIFAMRLDEIVPPVAQTLDQVRSEVTEAWTNQAIATQLRTETEPLVQKLATGASFEDAGLAIDGEQAVTRRGFVADTPAAFLETVFEMDAGQAEMIESNGRLYVVKLDSVSPPDPEDTDLQQLETLLVNQAASSLSQDLFQIVAEDIRTRAGIDLDQTAINAVHANFQ